MNLSTLRRILAEFEAQAESEPVYRKVLDRFRKAGVVPENPEDLLHWLRPEFHGDLTASDVADFGGSPYGAVGTGRILARALAEGHPRVPAIRRVGGLAVYTILPKKRVYTWDDVSDERIPDDEDE